MAAVLKEVSGNKSQRELAKVSHTELQFLNKKLKMQNEILMSLAGSLLYMQFEQLSERQRKGLEQMVRVQAGMVGLEVPGD